MNTTALILAAGKGKRVGSDTPKQYIKIADKPLLFYPLKAFEESHIHDVVLITSKDDVDMVQKDIIEKYGLKKVSAVITGGCERYDSVYEGLKYLNGSRTDSVLIHDGARPFISADKIDKMINLLKKEDAVILGMPVKDTIKLADDRGYIKSTTDRSHTWIAQTPQAFKYDLIFAAYKSIIGKVNGMGEHKRKEMLSIYTDDALVFSEKYPEKKILLAEGGHENIKITTPYDLKIADIFMK